MGGAASGVGVRPPRPSPAGWGGSASEGIERRAHKSEGGTESFSDLYGVRPIPRVPEEALVCRDSSAHVPAGGGFGGGPGTAVVRRRTLKSVHTEMIGIPDGTFRTASGDPHD